MSECTRKPAITVPARTADCISRHDDNHSAPLQGHGYCALAAPSAARMITRGPAPRARAEDAVSSLMAAQRALFQTRTGDPLLPCDPYGNRWQPVATVSPQIKPFSR